MNRPIFFLLIIFFIFSMLLPGEEQKQQTILAVRSDEPIKIDGIFNEKAWQRDGTSGFIQSEPVDGAPATEKTTVWIAYDNKALYIAAQLDDSEPGKIKSLLGRRDDDIDSDWFDFCIDPYYDRRSGYIFSVNPAGCIIDRTIYNDESTNRNWDGVWESHARIHNKGWNVEIKIPFDQLRFKKKESYTWGINFRRHIKRKNEWDHFVWIPKGESGFVSNFARLEGISGIKPKPLIEIIPFTAGKIALSTKEPGNPFATGHDYSMNAGVDMKIGLKSNLVLDLTVNPDFGQVEVDPAIINLSAAENYYSEKRPFFIEGATIFDFGHGGSNRFVGANWGGADFFYSRRIGRPPQGTANTQGYSKYPEWSTILAAAKVSGKLSNTWSIGTISAITQREYAEIDENNQRSHQEVEPFSYYNVIRSQKEFNNGLQGLGFITTSVFRDLNNPTMKNLLPDNALSFALDGWTFLDKDKTWVIAGWWGTSRISGDQTAILNRQLSYPHYFQRPDANHVNVNENATSMTGWAGRLTLNKQKGKFIVNASIGAVSPGFDSNDLGFLWDCDVINSHIMLAYREFKPGKIFRTWSTMLFTQRNYNFAGDKIGEQRLIFIGNAEFLNYWSLYSQISINPEHFSPFLTRGGPSILRRPFTWGEIGIDSDNRKPLVASLSTFFYSNSDGSQEWNYSCSLRWKSGANFSLLIQPSYNFEHETTQWVTNIEDSHMTPTYGTRYVFGEIREKTLACTIRLHWIFSPKISLQAYIQPFISVGSYQHFKELAQPRSHDFNYFGQGNSSINYSPTDDQYFVDPDGPGPAPLFSFTNPDFNYKSLRGTVVLRWEYRPGSTIFLVWTQNRADYSHAGDFQLGRDFSNLLSAPGDNIFMLKLTYRLKL